MEKHNIVCLPGDGIGKMVLEESVRVLDAAGFEVVKFFYVDSLGFFASFAARIFGYKGSTKLDEKTANYHVADARVLIFYDRLIYRVSRFFDFIGFRYILGKNIFVVAKVKKKR